MRNKTKHDPQCVDGRAYRENTPSRATDQLQNRRLAGLDRSCSNNEDEHHCDMAFTKKATDMNSTHPSKPRSETPNMCSTCQPAAGHQGRKKLEKRTTTMQPRSLPQLRLLASCGNWCVDATSPSHTIKVVIMQRRHRSVRRHYNVGPEKKNAAKKRHTTIPQ